MHKKSNLRKNAHAVVIGINKYQDKRISNLTFARADAEGIYNVLINPELGRIHPDNVILLLDEKATERNIRSAIGHELPRRADEKDLVFIYYAGHGAPVIDPKGRYKDGMEKYLIPCDAEIDKLRATGISMDDINKFFGWIESKQVLFFIDSCYSGEAGGRTFKDPQCMKRNVLTGEFLEELAGEGRLVVTACDVNEVSLETTTFGHGIFSYYLIQGLKGLADFDKDGLVTTRELYDYVYDNVSKQARQMSGSMHPIYKGSVRGRIFLTQYETEAQKQAKPLLAQAEQCYLTGKINQAYDLWQEVIKLLPEHERAKHGIIEIENKRREDEEKRQQILKTKKQYLFNLYRKKIIPAKEYDLAIKLIAKEAEELSESESEMRQFIDDLINEKISASTYLINIEFLRKSEQPEKQKVSRLKKHKIVEIGIPERIEKPVEKKEKITAKKKPDVREKTKVMPKKKVESPKDFMLKTTIKNKWYKPAGIIFAVVCLVIVAIIKFDLFNPKQILTTKTLRSEYRELSEDDVREMLRRYDFFDSFKNKEGRGFDNQYGIQTIKGEKVVNDSASGLMWQIGGSERYMTYEEAKRYVKDLRYAGYHDWRLPTLEEAMSLIEPEKKSDNLYINPLFDIQQSWIWSCDLLIGESRAAWAVGFNSGGCGSYDCPASSYVRAVRSGQSFVE